MNTKHNDYITLLGNPVGLAVLAHLYNTMGGFSARRLATLVNFSHSAVNAALVRLEQYGLVHSTPIGKAYSYILNREHLLVTRGLAPLFSTMQTWPELIGAYYLASLPVQPLSIILYGSFARHEATTKSDLDLLFLYANSDYHDDRLDEILAHSHMVKNMYGYSPEPIVMSLDHFQADAKAQKGFVTNIIREGKSIAGATITELRYA